MAPLFKTLLNLPKNLLRLRAFSLRRPLSVLSMVYLFACLLACSDELPHVWRVAPIAGASPLGTASCQMCHVEIVSSFGTASHAFFAPEESGHPDFSCEQCHGAGSLHLAAGGEGGILAGAQAQATCLNCHVERQSQFRLPHTHPVLSGRMGCVDCHDPHVGATKPLSHHGPDGQSQTCLDCHQEQAGPFVFEHEAMREGCVLCHDPHGSVNDKMLKIRGPSLCLQCHASSFSPSNLMIGNQFHGGNNQLKQGTCWTAGCHEAVHGSQVNPNLRF